MRKLIPPLVVTGVVLTVSSGLLAAGQESTQQYRTLNDRFTVPEYSAADWEKRAAWLREHVLASAGLLPMPEKTPLRAQIIDERCREEYCVSKVYFESLPGFFVTGNLYRPPGTGAFPAILSPHGHWNYGRLENTEINSGPARAQNLAAQGFVVFTYDMVGYNDSRQLTHEFGGRRENLWGLSLAGLQLWNSIRSLDFVESLPYVDRDRLGVTGESGGGTQTFLLAAADARIKVAAPVNMISLHMQGGCLCENQPGLRLDTNNVELAATFAPRPLLMVSATGDWTKETLEVEYPAMRKFYALHGAEDRVHAVRFQAPHNYNRNSREAVYAWMARWLKNAPADVRVTERSFPGRWYGPHDQLVFYGRPMPEGALSADQITERWIATAQQQLKQADQQTLRSALAHALALQPRARPAGTNGGKAPRSKTVIVAGGDSALTTALKRAGFSIRTVTATPFDAEAAAKINHFETYNRTAASQRVADIVKAIGNDPHATLVADGDWGLAAILASALVPVDRAVVDVAAFDNSSDAAFLERLYIPGLRRAGDVQTAVGMVAGTALTIHNAGERFVVEGPRVEKRPLSAKEIVALLK